jgi:hypothetical protein
VLEGVPPEDRRKLLYENAIRLYRIDARLSNKTSLENTPPCG